MSRSPTQLTLAKVRADGWLAEVVERWVPGANIRKDLWGFVDVLCIRDGEVLAIQSTSDSNVSARVKKIAEHPNIAEVRKLNWTLVVHGWRKQGNRWTCREVDVS